VSAPAGQPPQSGPAAPFAWLPARLRPRDREQPGSGSLRLVETTLLVIVALLLAVVTVYDLHRQTRINDRLSADETTWRHYTHLDVELSVDTILLGTSYKSTREVVCGNTSPGKPGTRPQLCLEIWGPVRAGVRTVHGGWYLPRKTPDVTSKRYRCFGYVPPHICPT
jgi:hypothetical protein